MNETLIIKNNGPEIIGTNYWQSSYARAGKFYLSVNARAFRLLIPWQTEAPVRNVLDEIRTSVDIIVSSGPWPAAGRPDGIELLFDDCSDAPYALQLSPEQVDRLPAAGDSGREDLTFSAWVYPGKKAIEYPTKFRTVSEIPCLKKWSK